MPLLETQPFGKDERLSGKREVDRLFSGTGSKVMTAFPVRLVYRVEERPADDSVAAKVLVSVPKRCFKRAVKRNRMKRLMREAYRRNKSILAQNTTLKAARVLMAFIWVDANLRSYAEVEAAIVRLLNRLNERI